MKKYLITSLLFAFSFNSWAIYICTGKVTGLAINPKDGYLLAETIGPLTW